MSDYDFRPGGSLKLKGGVVEGGIVKKKKKSKAKSKDKDKDKDKDKEAAAESSRSQEMEKLLEEEERKSGSPGPSSSKPVITSERKTTAEKRFEEVQKKRLAGKVARMATKTHKDRVNEFNNKLEALSEHHDIPKVCSHRIKL
ncbi:hypothetical protein BDY19DRAFT_916275 [Irpex rosettiformis]|uniref:Uncharacterized protein n=1 Tax=Irpex rosettiformis TaxID=378272 RepID=A0ACB8UL12_9APHY|nr:hypothetical protein BDY19DRAFT_916275 [Irpex rosettiformis]